MEVLLNKEFESKEDVYTYLMTNLYIEYEEPNMWFINVSKFLRDDLTFNLELLELAIEYIIQNGANDYVLIGQGKLWEYRKMATEAQWDEEYGFIKGFISSVWEELNHAEDEEFIEKHKEL